MGYPIKNQKIIALSHSKLRNAIGMVGIEIDIEKRIAYVRLAKSWRREEMNQMPIDIKSLYEKIKWDKTYADQAVGQHLLKSIEAKISFTIFTITTQKNLKDPEDVEKIKVMDQTEMTQLFLSLKLAHKIQFPKPKNQKVHMINLIKQVEIFTEHTTEQGNVTYYAPGDELDNLTKALMICCFVGRHLLTEGETPMIIQIGSTPIPPKPKSYEESFVSSMIKPTNNKYTDIIQSIQKAKSKRIGKRRF